MIDCKELEDMIEQWYHLSTIPKPQASAASMVSYKSMLKMLSFLKQGKINMKNTSKFSPIFKMNSTYQN